MRMYTRAGACARVCTPVWGPENSFRPVLQVLPPVHPFETVLPWTGACQVHLTGWSPGRLYFTVLRLPVGPTVPGFKRKTKTKFLGLNSHPRAHKTNTLLPELTPNLNQTGEMCKTQSHCLAFPSFCLTHSQRICSNCI